ncbi:MAG: Dna2/Cas4 domain-containing protein [Candidatus Methanofastidiosia archaeon]|jgi:CRISPR/Cas system-associated exonuclease Cas4 (RecB family)
MTFGMALVSRILTGEEPCLRKVQYRRIYELPTDCELIKHKMNHELLVSKVIDRLTGEIYVNYRVEKEIEDIKLVGYIDILNVNPKLTTVYEVKTGKERDSHHVQLWMYMGCLNGARGVLKYTDEQYLYFPEDIPFYLWNLVSKRLKPLETNKLLPPVKGSHCSYCKYKWLCQHRIRNKKGVIPWI